MNDKNNNNSLNGVPPTKEDEFFISWGRESLKNNLVLANDVLKQLVTLNSVLLGGSIAFLDEKVVSAPYKVFTIICFLFSLIISFLGILPYEGYVDLREPESIKQHKKQALKSKLRFLWWASFVMFLGFVISLAGIIAVFWESPN